MGTPAIVKITLILDAARRPSASMHDAAVPGAEDVYQVFLILDSWGYCHIQYKPRYHYALAE